MHNGKNNIHSVFTRYTAVSVHYTTFQYSFYAQKPSHPIITEERFVNASIPFKSKRCFCTPERPDPPLGPHILLLNGYWWFFPPAVKRSGRVADHYLPSGPDIKKACSCTSFPPIFLHNMHCDMSPTSIGDLLGSTIRRFGREALTGLFFTLAFNLVLNNLLITSPA
jgi:hypothetical protein